MGEYRYGYNNHIWNQQKGAYGPGIGCYYEPRQPTDAEIKGIEETTNSLVKGTVGFCKDLFGLLWHTSKGAATEYWSFTQRAVVYAETGTWYSRNPNEDFQKVFGSG